MRPVPTTPVRLAAVLFALLPPPARALPALPPIVFVSRMAPAAGAVPGLGPAGRTVLPGGRLLVRGPSGRVRALVPSHRFADVARPAVDVAGRRVAFAAAEPGTGQWRLWIVNASGESLRAVPAGNGDAFDPCWLPDGRLVFASTREGARAEGDARPAANLYAVAPDGTGLRRLTSDRNGAEKPALDPLTGHVLYARWWQAHWRASEDPGGVTADPGRALPGDGPDLWQAVDILPDGDALRLAGGEPARRAAQEAYAPCRLRDGTLVGVAAARTSLVPEPGPATVVAFPGGFGPRRVLAGALRGAGTSATAPAPLPDGRVLLALAPDGRDFGIWVCDSRGRGLQRVLDLPGTLELDPVPLVAASPRPPVAEASLAPPAAPPLPGSRDSLERTMATFRFDCMNVFTQGAVDGPFPDAPRLQPGVRIRFYAAISRPGAPGGDTLVLLREAPLTAAGAVHVDELPADVPMLEQLVDAHGRVLAGAGGPAHTASFNWARTGSGTRCVGCHVGHSALPVPRNGTSAAYVNAAPSARASASDSVPGSAGARGAVDRRTRGPAADAGWVPRSAPGAWLRLDWEAPLDVREVVLHGFARGIGANPGIGFTGCNIQLRLGGRPVKTVTHRRSAGPGVTRVTLGGVRADALVLSGLRGAPHAGIAEVEVVARLAGTP